MIPRALLSIGIAALAICLFTALRVLVSVACFALFPARKSAELLFHAVIKQTRSFQQALEARRLRTTPFRSVRVIAHRGGREHSVENTLAAFADAFLHEPSCMIELDVRLTADEQVVVFHDPTTERMCTGASSVRIAHTALADLPPIKVVADDAWDHGRQHISAPVHYQGIDREGSECARPAQLATSRQALMPALSAECRKLMSDDSSVPTLRDTLDMLLELETHVHSPARLIVEFKEDNDLLLQKTQAMLQEYRMQRKACCFSLDAPCNKKLLHSGFATIVSAGDFLRTCIGWYTGLIHLFPRTVVRQDVFGFFVRFTANKEEAKSKLPWLRNIAPWAQEVIFRQLGKFVDSLATRELCAYLEAHHACLIWGLNVNDERTAAVAKKLGCRAVIADRIGFAATLFPEAGAEDSLENIGTASATLRQRSG